MLRISRPVILILAAVLILAGCSGGDADLEAVDPEMVSEATISDGDQPTVTATTTPTTTTVLAFSLDALNPAMEAGGVMALLGDLACGLRADGDIECWGTPPRFTGGLNYRWDLREGSFIALSGSCGLRPDQTIQCWNGFDPPAGRFTAISHEGSWHACGVRVDQIIECWGDDEVESGRFGRCPANERPCHNQGQNGYDQAIPPEGTFTAVATGGWHSCGLRTDQTIECWGRNDSGIGPSKQAEPPEGTFTAIASGHLHSCGVRTDQTIECWGSNTNGGFTSGQANPPEGTFTAVTAGTVQSCGIRTDQTIECWGEYASSGSLFVYEAVSPGGRFVAVIAGGDYSCGLRTGGTIECWGIDDSLSPQQT